MTLPLSTKEFALDYSGSFGKMDAPLLNPFLELSQHRRIKSGTLQSAKYNITVKAGHASGTLQMYYKDLSIAVLDKTSGSDKGIINKLSSLYGKLFVIRNSNLPS